MAIVYQHRRLDNDEIFYIGIGKKESRAFNKKNRSTFWKNYILKHDYYVEITHKDIIWEEACCIEKYLISFYGRKDLKTGCLVNCTDGGDGVKNLSIESRKKMASQKNKFGKLNNFYGKKHTGDLSRFGIKNKGKKSPMKGKKYTGDTTVFGIKNKGKIPINKDRVCINNSFKNKYIKKEDLNYYKKLGWFLGGKKRKINYE